MRIGIFTNTFWPSVNGVAVSVANLMAGLEDLGHEAIVFAPKTPGFDHRLDPPGVVRFTAFAPRCKPDYPIAIPCTFSSFEAFQRLWEFRPEVIHCHHPWWVGKWGIWDSVLRETPCVLTVHTQFELYAGYVPLPEYASKAIIRAKLVNSCSMVDLVTTPGEGMRQHLRKLGIQTPIHCVSNPTKLKEFSASDPKVIRQKFGVSPNEVLLGYVGRLNEEKNLDVLIDTFAIIAAQRDDVKLIIVGDGTDRERLEKRANQVVPGRIFFTGNIPHSEVVPYFAAIDIFVTPSKSEVQPMSFAEAFAAKTPIVAFDVAGCNDMIKPGVSGYLVPFDNGARGLAGAVLELIADPDNLARLCESAKLWADQYDQAVAVSSMVDIYNMARELNKAR